MSGDLRPVNFRTAEGQRRQIVAEDAAWAFGDSSTRFSDFGGLSDSAPCGGASFLSWVVSVGLLPAQPRWPGKIEIAERILSLSDLFLHFDQHGLCFFQIVRLLVAH